MGRIRVGILYGGRSAEHEVSCESARNVVTAMDRSKYELFLIEINKEGEWFLRRDSDLLSSTDHPAQKESGERVVFVSDREGSYLFNLSTGQPVSGIDLVLPILHGPYGEDGTVQGLLKLANIPFVGAGVLGSAVGMDKDVMKRLLKEAGIPIGDFLVYSDHQLERIRFSEVRNRLGIPIYVKPANLGSSVGISRVEDEERFSTAIEEAFRYDRKIVLEENIKGREIECSVLGNESPKASLPGEIIPKQAFYSYQAKYIEENGATLKIPADLAKETVREVQELAIKTFKALCCEGLARVDFFLKEDGALLVNEINTLPGFTRISMYPKLWEASGLPYGELIDRLVELAIERQQKERRLRVSR